MILVSGYQVYPRLYWYYTKLDRTLQPTRVERDMKPIRTEADHETALAEVGDLWQAPPGSPESERLEILATLIEAYEEANHPIDPTSCPRKPGPLTVSKESLRWLRRS